MIGDWSGGSIKFKSWNFNGLEGRRMALFSQWSACTRKCLGLVQRAQLAPSYVTTKPTKYYTSSDGIY